MAPTVRIRHVWCRPNKGPTEIPGLVLGWRQNPEWEAQVIFVDPRGRTEIAWLPADELRPVKSEPYMGSAYG